MQEPEEKIYSYQLTEAISSLEETRAFVKQYEAPDAMQYFFVKVKDTNPYKTIKSAPAMTFKRKLTPGSLEDPCPSGAFLWNYVSPSPSEVNKVPPMSFRYLRGVEALKEKIQFYKSMIVILLIMLARALKVEFPTQFCLKVCSVMVMMQRIGIQ